MTETAPLHDDHPAEILIRALRERSNAAIAARDVAGMQSVLDQTSVVLPGGTGLPAPYVEFAARMHAAFADSDFVGWVRTPDTVKIARSGRRAAEVGRWIGRWRKEDGEMHITGIYQAMWVPTPDGWRLRNESFVALDCGGSAECIDAG